MQAILFCCSHMLTCQSGSTDCEPILCHYNKLPKAGYFIKKICHLAIWGLAYANSTRLYVSYMTLVLHVKSVVKSWQTLAKIVTKILNS